MLDKATGVSEYVIAVNLDIRSFTPFCQSVDSVDVATYIKKIYSKIINGYFKNASYYKPTGDGLIIIIPYSEGNLEEVANSTIESCLELLKNFGSLCNNEAMITYPTPQKMGIGVTRGSACCIRSEDKILDYSGKILNLASRLMDLARPSGMVLDHGFDLGLLKDEIKDLLSEDDVYVRGVAEKHPLRVYCTKKYTIIPDSCKRPLKEPQWKTNTWTKSVATLRAISIPSRFTLSKRPLDASKLVFSVILDYPKIEGAEILRDFFLENKEINYKTKGDQCYVLVDIPSIVRQLDEIEGLAEDTEIRIEATYPIE